MKNAFHSI